MPKSKTRVCYFPSQATHFFVVPELNGEELIACVVSGREQTIKVTESENDFYTNKCRNGCPYFVDVEEKLQSYLANGYSRLGAREKISKETATESTCTATRDEMIHSCQWGSPLSGQTEISVNSYDSLWLYRPGKSKRNAFVMQVINSELFNETGELQTKPYRFANVYPDGAICWGKIRKPSHLKEAYMTFWNSEFNPSLSESTSNFRQQLKDFSPEALKEPWLKTGFGPNVAIREGNCDGVIYSISEKITGAVPEAHHHQPGLVVGFFKKVNLTCWLINFNGYLVLRDGRMNSSGKFVPIGTLEEVQGAS